MSLKAARFAVEATITALSAKVMAAIDNDNPEAAAGYSGALRDACCGLDDIVRAQLNAEDDDTS